MEPLKKKNLCEKRICLYKLGFERRAPPKVDMGKHCDLCRDGRCQNEKVHFSTEDADVAYRNVVRASKYAEDCKADVQAGRPLDALDYGTLDMEEGEAKEAAKAEGVALAAHFAEKREARLGAGQSAKLHPLQ